MQLIEMESLLQNEEVNQRVLKRVRELAIEFKQNYGRMPVIMEVCGSHTMALARTGLKKVLQNDVQLISGPGCPVCVTDQKDIDEMILLAEQSNVIVATFGDMMRVPGSGKSLMQCKLEGCDIRVVYSPLDAIRLAKEHPDKEVVFLGIGFETTIPILGALVQQAKRENISNVSLWTTTKLVEPVLRTLLESEEVGIDGFLLPGHVAIVLGENHFSFLAKEYDCLGVISGFEPLEMITSIYQSLELLLNGDKRIINNHPSVVTKCGNEHAQKFMHDTFDYKDARWRGLGTIPKSGLGLREDYALWDGKKKFKIESGKGKETKCRCGEIIKGKINPPECALFGKACTPLFPIGPCMVSTEGTCSAYYQYLREE